MNDYFNTTSLTGEDLKEAKERARTQQEAILAFFEEHPNERFTPFEVQEETAMMFTPITSIRRAITNLTDAGKLEKTERVRPGRYGKTNYTWRLAS